MKPYIRAHIALDTQSSVLELLKILGNEGDRFVIENADASHRVNARSMLGLLYMVTEHPSELFIMNIDKDGEFPPALDNFRIYGTPSTETFTF